MDDPIDRKWRSLPVSAVAALYINGMQRFVRENLVAFFGAGTGFAISDALGWREFILGGSLLLLGGLLIAIIYHRRFRYRIDDDAVRVRRGLFEQKELKVRFERVQNVGFSQPLYLRPLGLVRVSLETPGAAQTEVNLPGIAADEGELFRERIAGLHDHSDRHGSGAEGPDADREPEPLFEAGAADLFQYGLTSNQVWILFALFGAPVMNRVEQWTSDWIERLEADGLLTQASGLPLAEAPWILAVLIGAFLIALALVLMFLSGLISVVRFYGYRLTTEGDRFKGRYGLLDVREKTLRRAKLHSVELVQTAMGRVLGQWHAVGHQTGLQAGQGGQAALVEDRRFLVPGVDQARLADVAGALTGRTWREPCWCPVSRHLRTVLWTRISAALLILAASIWMLAEGRPVWPVVAVVSINAVIVVMVHLQWRRWGYALDQGRLTVRSGMIGQRIVEFAIDRCQQVRVSASPYQRRHGLATLHLRLPHGEQMIPYLSKETADKIANGVLYRVESAASHAL